ncbi:MAG: DUF2087 domain-containing protein [Lapillicoccus sp.]
MPDAGSSGMRVAGYGGRMDRLSLEDALSRREAVLRVFVAEDGSLRSIPTKAAKRMVVLDHVVQAFPIGESWPEVEVNDVLRRYHPDVAALRRYLVDDGFLDRRDGRYWRSGGSTDV